MLIVFKVRRITEDNGLKLSSCELVGVHDSGYLLVHEESFVIDCNSVKISKTLSDKKNSFFTS